jgi:hypothetical protein
MGFIYLFNNNFNNVKTKLYKGKLKKGEQVDRLGYIYSSKRKNKDKVGFAEEDFSPRYYALQDKEDGHLMMMGLTGKVVVTTHKMPTKGYKVVELVIKDYKHY